MNDTVAKKGIRFYFQFLVQVNPVDQATFSDGYILMHVTKTTSSLSQQSENRTIVNHYVWIQIIIHQNR